jgi:hypothetical protein
MANWRAKNEPGVQQPPAAASSRSSSYLSAASSSSSSMQIGLAPDLPVVVADSGCSYLQEDFVICPRRPGAVQGP